MQQTGSEADVEKLTTSSSSGTSRIEVEEMHTGEIFHDLQAFQLDIQMTDVEEWLEDADVSQTTDEDLTDEQIIPMVKNNTPANEEDDTDEDEKASDGLVTHSAARNVCEVLL